MALSLNFGYFQEFESRKNFYQFETQNEFNYFSNLRAERNKRIGRFLAKEINLFLGFWLQWNPALRPPRYYGHFGLSRQNALTFSYNKTPLMRPPR